MKSRKCHPLTIPDEEIGIPGECHKLSEYLNNGDLSGIIHKFYTPEFSKKIISEGEVQSLEIADHNVLTSFIREVTSERFCVVINSQCCMNSMKVLYARTIEEAIMKQKTAFIMFDNDYSTQDIAMYLAC